VVRYLQEGDADFERLNRINRRAIRSAWQAALLMLTFMVLFALWLGLAILAWRVPHLFRDYITGSIIGGLVAWLLFRWRVRHR